MNQILSFAQLYVTNWATPTHALHTQPHPSLLLSQTHPYTTQPHPPMHYVMYTACIRCVELFSWSNAKIVPSLLRHSNSNPREQLHTGHCIAVSSMMRCLQAPVILFFAYRMMEKLNFNINFLVTGYNYRLEEVKRNILMTITCKQWSDSSSMKKFPFPCGTTCLLYNFFEL